MLESTPAIDTTHSDHDRRCAMSKRVLLIIGGGIAAYKSLELIRLLAKEGVKTRAILTRAGGEFVTPLAVGALTQDKVYQDLFNLTDENEMGHIELSRSADLVVVAPATANLMARAANGIAAPGRRITPGSKRRPRAAIPSAARTLARVIREGSPRPSDASLALGPR